MSHGPKIQNTNLNIRVSDLSLASIRKHAAERGQGVSEFVRAAADAACTTRTPEQLVEHARACGFDHRQALVHACSVSDNLSLRAAAAKLLAYGECDVPTGPAEEAGSVTVACLLDLGLHREHGPLEIHERVDGVDWWTFFLD